MARLQIGWRLIDLEPGHTELVGTTQTSTNVQYGFSEDGLLAHLEIFHPALGRTPGDEKFYPRYIKAFFSNEEAWRNSPLG